MSSRIKFTKYIFSKGTGLKIQKTLHIHKSKDYIHIYFSADFDEVVLTIADKSAMGRWPRDTWIAIQRAAGDYIIYCNQMYDFLIKEGVHHKTAKRYKGYKLHTVDFMEFIGEKLK